MIQPTETQINEALAKIPMFLAREADDTWDSTEDNEWDINFYVSRDPKDQNMFSLTLYKVQQNEAGQFYTNTAVNYPVPLSLTQQKAYVDKHPENITVNRVVKIGELFTITIHGGDASIESHVETDDIAEDSFIDGIMSALLAIAPLINWNAVAMSTLVDTLGDAIGNYDGR